MDEPHAAVALSHPLKGRKKINVSALENANILALNEGFITRRTFDAACRLAHVEPHRILESGAPHTVLSLAEAGVGIAIVPSTVKLDRYALHVAPVVQSGIELEIRLALSWNRGQFLARYVQCFIEETTKVAAEQLDSV